MIVDITEIERCLKYFKQVNDCPFEDIIWVKDGVPLLVDPETSEDFKFIGLSNRDFPSICGWMPDDVGIRVSSFTFTKE